MKKWFEFFFLSFFSHKLSKEGTRRGYTNVFLSFVLALAFIWTALVGAEMLPFGIHYRHSDGFRETVHTLFASPDAECRIDAQISDGRLTANRAGGEHSGEALVNTLEREGDREKYSSMGYDVVVDTRPANTLAEVEAYCVSNDGKNTEISYEDYLTLSEVARLNFDFKIRYTGKELTLDTETVERCRAYLDGLGQTAAAQLETLDKRRSDGEITESEYNREIYEICFVNYYPSISDYESTSRVPLLRNYYYHKYISRGIDGYLFIFDDYMAGSFEAVSGEFTFYGFYGDLADGPIILPGASDTDARDMADGFVQKSFNSAWSLNAYAHFMNVVSLAPFIALMLMVAVLLTYSVLKLKGVESVSTLASMLKIVGSYAWFSGIAAAVLTVPISLFAGRGLIVALPPTLFFAVLAVRSLIFALKEDKLYQIKQSELSEL